MITVAQNMHSQVQKTTGNFPKTKTRRSNPRTSLKGTREETIFRVQRFIRKYFHFTKW